MGARRVVLDLIGDIPEWQEKAACKNTDPDAFFPQQGGSVLVAKRICARCEVKADCLQQGLNEGSGIWGGLTERERRKLKRRAA